MSRKHRSDSLKGLLAATAEQEQGYSVPDGLCSLTDREQLAWRQYCLARGGWKESELRILHRAVRLESELELMQEEASAIPTIYEKPSGDIAEHPIHGSVRNLRKSLQSELRMVGLQCSPDRNIGTGNHGRAAQRNSLAGQNSLLARRDSLIG